MCLQVYIWTCVNVWVHAYGYKCGCVYKRVHVCLCECVSTCLGVARIQPKEVKLKSWERPSLVPEWRYLWLLFCPQCRNTSHHHPSQWTNEATQWASGAIFRHLFLALILKSDFEIRLPSFKIEPAHSPILSQILRPLVFSSIIAHCVLWDHAFQPLELFVIWILPPF